MKRVILCVIYSCILISLSACSVKKTDTENIKEISFTVVGEEAIPEELKAEIAKQEAGAFKITYKDKGALYISEGYGEQETSGYSVEVTKCCESEDVILVHTNLIGPSKEEKVVQSATNPYVVIKLDAADKNVVFE